MNIQDNFVSHDIALAMKELGFDEEVCAIFRKDRFYPILGFERINSVKKSVIAAPLYQQCIDWFREKHRLVLDVGYRHTSKMFKINGINSVYFDIKIYTLIGGDAHKTYKFQEYSDNYYKCLDKALEEAFKLI